MLTTTPRLSVIDALRGFAMVSILLLHNLEHFDFYYFPEGLPDWMKTVDKGIWNTMFFLFAGKSYAMFSLLFGFTFYLQSSRQEALGKSFKLRFAWRMLLLLGFGMLNTVFFHGDILTFYAVIGLVLIPVEKLPTKIVFSIAVLLMLQPAEWVKFFMALQNPDEKLGDPVSWAYFGRAAEYFTNGSIVDVWHGNLTNGKTGVIIWNWEEGRMFQTASLFMLGMLAGRLGLFIVGEEQKKIWTKVLIYASIVFIPLLLIKLYIGDWIDSVAVRRPLATIETTWTNLAFMLVLVSGFVLLFQQQVFKKIFSVLIPLGRMSLTNYLLHAVLGTSIYYGFGLGLFQYTGATYSLLIGIALATVQGVFCAWWLKSHKQGPLEALWHKATWM